jgi:hypothetical protein
MTVLDDILPLLAEYMNDGIVGTLNAVNPGVIDHSTILKWYKELQNPTHEWEEVETLELGSGRSNNELDTTRIQSLSFVPNIQDSVRQILEKNKF